MTITWSTVLTKAKHTSILSFFTHRTNYTYQMCFWQLAWAVMKSSKDVKNKRMCIVTMYTALSVLWRPKDIPNFHIQLFTNLKYRVNSLLEQITENSLISSHYLLMLINMYTVNQHEPLIFTKLINNHLKKSTDYAAAEVACVRPLFNIQTSFIDSFFR
jgi:hypothetical protein